METFTWSVRPAMRIESAPRVRQVAFGDGYEQRRPDGRHPDLKKFSVQLAHKHAEAQAVEAFLARHGGVKAFWWTPPMQTVPIRVVCRKWSATVNALRTEFSAEFEQVVA